MIACSSESDPWGCRFTNGQFEAAADTTPDAGGHGAGFRPHELLEASLATCLNVSVRMVATERGHDVEEVTTAVDLDRTSDRTTFRYSVAIEGVDGAAEAAIRDAVAECPVHETLSTSLEFVDAGPEGLDPDRLQDRD